MAYRGSLHEGGSRRPTGIVSPASATREPFSAISRRLPRTQKLRLRQDLGRQLCGDKSERLVGSSRPQAEQQDRLLCGSLYQLSSSRAQRVHRTAHAAPADLEHIHVNHRRRNIGMAKQFLHCADVVA